MRGLLSGKFSRERCKRVASCESRCVACRVSRVAWYCEPAPHDTAQALIISYRSEFALGRRYTAPRGFTYRCFTGKYIPQKKFHVKCCQDQTIWLALSKSYQISRIVKLLLALTLQVSTFQTVINTLVKIQYPVVRKTIIVKLN